MRAIRVEICRVESETGADLSYDVDILDVPSYMRPEEVEEYLQRVFAEDGVDYIFRF